jgi:hypothetical protein
VFHGWTKKWDIGNAVENIEISICRAYMRSIFDAIFSLVSD